MNQTCHNLNDHISAHYELLTESNMTEQNCPDTSPRLKKASIKSRSEYRNIRRGKRSTTDPVKISTTFDIIGHSEKPFQQRKNFYPELNYTDIIVEAHNVSPLKLSFNKRSS